jgi:CubicO group peptidase (beta-lactamase class C family)
MDSLLAGAIDSGAHVGVSALVYDEGRVVYKNAFGMADRERGYPASVDTVWRIYSMTKPVTAALIMDLREDGLLELEDPVSKHIPELANMQVLSLGEDDRPKLTPQARPMTIKDLLLHRAGMGYGIFGEINPVESAYTKAGLFKPDEGLDVKMQKLAKLPLLAQPGDGWYYSYSIDVLGRIAEVVTGERLGDLMQRRVFGPLGMSETSFRVRPSQKERFATNYFLDDEGNYSVQEESQTSPFLNDNAFQSAGGGLVSTLDDYAKFAQMMLKGGHHNGTQILEPISVKMMMSDQMDADDKFMMPWLGGPTNASFGFGGSVQIKSDPKQVSRQGKAKGQWGWGGAARTNFWVDPDSNAFGIIMLQYFGQEDPALHDSFQALVYAQTKNGIAAETTAAE